MIELAALRGWIRFEDERLLVVDKPAGIVCHPSKAGSRSSLVGAVREYCGLPAVHLVFRLDRETSGIVVLAKDAETASALQQALQRRQIAKTYLAVLWGELRGRVRVDQPLADDRASPVSIKSAVVPGGQPAVTVFSPLHTAEGFTLCRAEPETGRKHQIRAHAQWLGFPVVGDKLYGPDPRCFLDFIERGWTPELAERLLLPRHALHCAEIDLRPAGWAAVFRARLAADLREFCRARLGLEGEI